MVGEYPGLGTVLLRSAGPATGLEEGFFVSGAGRGELCLTGERDGDCEACRCSIGLGTRAPSVLPSGGWRGDTCLVGENPGDGGAWLLRLGPVTGLDDGI